MPSHHLPELGVGEDFLEGRRRLNPLMRLLREKTKKMGFSMLLKVKH